MKGFSFTIMSAHYAAEHIYTCTQKFMQTQMTSMEPLV